jgi:hypothetical protein
MGFRTLTASDVPTAFSVQGRVTVIGGDVALNNTGTFFDGPTQSVVAGVGCYYVSGTIAFKDTAGAAQCHAILWDGTSTVVSGNLTTAAANFVGAMALSGYIAAPAGNIRISVKDATSTSGAIIANATGAGKDSNLTCIRVA